MSAAHLLNVIREVLISIRYYDVWYNCWGCVPSIIYSQSIGFSMVVVVFNNYEWTVIVSSFIIGSQNWLRKSFILFAECWFLLIWNHFPPCSQGELILLGKNAIYLSKADSRKFLEVSIFYNRWWDQSVSTMIECSHSGQETKAKL